jgi:hypothetical protein
MDIVRAMSREGKVTTEQLVAGPGRYLMCSRGSYGVTKLLDRIGPERVILVWSLWRGYWERRNWMRAWAESRGVAAQFIHSGGHAWPEDLDRLVEAVAANETIWVHTDERARA